MSRSGRAGSETGSAARLQQGVVGVHVATLTGQSKVALGVCGVVESPVRHGGTGHAAPVDVGAAQHGESGEPPAEGPATDGHFGRIEIRVLVGQGREGVDLIGKDDIGEPWVDHLRTTGRFPAYRGCQ